MDRGEQNNGNTRKLKEQNIFVFYTLREHRLATLNIILPFVYTLQCSR
jgi:hypothetical protein